VGKKIPSSPQRTRSPLSSPIRQRHSLHRQLRDNENRIAELEGQLIGTQKLATLGTMACLVAHEFNNILSPMINYAELALRHEDDQPLMRKALAKTIQHGNRAAAIIESMLGLVRDHNQQSQAVEVAALVEDCLQCLGRDLAKDRIKVSLAIPSDLQAYGVPSQLQQVLLNLIINARQAMLTCGGALVIGAHPVRAGEGDASGGAKGEGVEDRVEQAGSRTSGWVDIYIKDTGCGIEAEIAERIFEPFFSTKADASRPDARGTGLGLAVCKQIIEAHQGCITLESTPGEGTTFTLRLPGGVCDSVETE